MRDRITRFRLRARRLSSMRFLALLMFGISPRLLLALSHGRSVHRRPGVREDQQE